jgi:hypothetical protein
MRNAECGGSGAGASQPDHAAARSLIHGGFAEAIIFGRAMAGMSDGVRLDVVVVERPHLKQNR